MVACRKRGHLAMSRLTPMLRDPMIAPQFPHIALTVDEQLFITCLWHALQASGRLLAREHVASAVTIVDRAFAPVPIQPQNV